MDKHIYSAKLQRVVDGDTCDALIDLGFDTWVKKRIRYKGIDTWESRTKDLDEKKLGLAAKDRNKELLESVSSKSGYFRLKSHGVGKYGRVLGEIFVKDIEGIEYQKKLSGIPARVFQHEYDHMEGKNFTQLVSPLKLDIGKRKAAKALKKQKIKQKNARNT